MAYLGVFKGVASKLRNSLSRREFFRQGDEYYKAFNLRTEDGEESAGPLPDDFKPIESSNLRALQILAARCLEQSCRLGIAAIQDKQKRGSLRKGAFYLGRIVYLKHKGEIDSLIAKASAQDRRADIARQLIEALNTIGEKSFDDARITFNKALEDYVKKEGGNEDAALKNTRFATLVDERANPQTP